MYSKILFKLSNDKGMALIATLIFVAVISTFGIALLTMTSSDIKLSSLQEASKEAFYIAEAGLERAIEYLEALGNPKFFRRHPLVMKMAVTCLRYGNIEFVSNQF